MSVRTITVRERVMEKNDACAREVRRRLEEHRVTAFNLVSSPGSGKTLLLEETLERLCCAIEIAVITGDVQTQNDADRISAHTDRLVQAVVTGGACHLDARQVSAALESIDLKRTDVIFIENVGNLVCPVSWDLGEEAKIVVFSVTEGEDKPLKYPKTFREARYAVLNKIDLLEHVDFDVDKAIGYAKEINPDLRFFLTSALTGVGMGEWCNFVEAHARDAVVA